MWVRLKGDIPAFAIESVSPVEARKLLKKYTPQCKLAAPRSLETMFIHRGYWLNGAYDYTGEILLAVFRVQGDHLTTEQVNAIITTCTEYSFETLNTSDRLMLYRAIMAKATACSPKDYAETMLSVKRWQKKAEGSPNM